MVFSLSRGFVRFYFLFFNLFDLMWRLEGLDIEIDGKAAFLTS